MQFELISHRVSALESSQKEIETRVRVLEIGYAKLVAYAAGGAFIGGLAVQLLQMFLTRS